ncbi:MAG: hypothetical protein NTV51_23585 [Verrucomicrobia bacterium]|nr:hypothetical protein [Verrucomicrobiota bacterium]
MIRWDSRSKAHTGVATALLVLVSLLWAPAASAQGAPRITRSPQNLISSAIPEGYSTSFFCYYTATGSCTARWLRDGIVVREQTGVTSGQTSFDLVSATPADTGTYWVEVFNGSGTAQSGWFSVIVRPPEAPYFIQGPEGRASASWLIQPSVGGDGSIDYQWFRNGAAVPGLTHGYLADSDPAGTYTLRVRSPWGEATSPSFTVGGPATGPNPGIVRQPVSVISMGIASDYDISVGTDSTNVTYQWLREGQAIAGATQSYLSFAPYDHSKAGRYRVTVRNAAGGVTQSAESVVQTRPGHETPHIRPLPAGPLTRKAGESLTLYGQLFGFGDNPLPMHASSTSPPTYAWYRNGELIAGATGAVLFVPRLEAGHAGSYTLRVEDGSRRQESPAVVLSIVGGSGAAPFVLKATQTTTSGTRSASAGEAYVVTAEIVSAEPVTYEWYRNGVRLPQFTGPTLRIPNLATVDAGTYALVVRNGTGAVQAFSEQLTVANNPSAPSRFINQPPPQVLILPGNTFVPASSYTGSPNVVWKRNGQTVSGFGFGISYDPAQAGTYTQELQPLAGSAAATVVSEPMVVTMAPADSAGIYTSTPDFLFDRRGTSPNGCVAYIRPDRTVTMLNFGSPAPTQVVERLQLDAGGRAPYTEISLDAGVTGLAVTMEANAGRLATSTSVTASPRPAYLGATRVTSGAFARRAGYFRGRVDGPDGGDAHAILAPNGILGVLAFLGGRYYTGYARMQDGQSVTITQVSPPLGQPLPSSTLTLSLDAAHDAVAGTITRTGSPTRSFTATRAEPDLGSRLSNLASRGTVGAGDQTMIAGFTLTGAARMPLLVRGIGPALAGFGVSGAIADPLLTIYQGSTLVAQNDNWSEVVDRSAVVTAAAQVGAFGLTPGSKDAALIAKGQCRRRRKRLLAGHR